MLSVYFVTMTLMSELPAGDTHDVIRQSGQATRMQNCRYIPVRWNGSVQGGIRQGILCPAAGLRL